ncbi:MAG TPA: tetratricopeptide repeat protein, partial [Pyrinomonadaceae bacterium]|nr:tetratricopeptide repeat protein [Pyrinomonadaceae bacterium]
MNKILVMLALISLGLAQAGCSSKKPAPTENNAIIAVVESPEAEATPAEIPEDDEEGEAGTSNSEALAAFERGKDLSLRDQDQEAVEAFQQAIAADADYAEAYFRMAYSYTALAKKDDATEAFEKAAKAYEKYVRKHSKDARAHFNMGLAYSKLLKPAEAVKAFRQAVKLEPENGEFHYELGLSLSKLAEYDQALIALQKSMDLDPDNFRAGEAIEKAKLGKQ